jgi:spore coat polysaccharide biosynthesis predicted glycosyltransferase SpsG
MKKKYIKIFIFSEFSKKIGMGHYIRSKRLYDFLKKKNRVFIYMNKNKKFLENVIKKNSINSIFIFDFKNYDKFKINYNKSCKYVFFDKYKKTVNSEININPLFPSTSRYSGPKWFSFPLNFFNESKIIIKNKDNKKRKQVLICQGGTDAHNNLNKLIRIIKNKLFNLDLDLSVLAPKQYKINNNTKKKYSIKIFKNIKNIYRFINKFDHIITSGGGFAYEVNFLCIDCTYVTSESREIKLCKFLEKKRFGKTFKIHQINKIKKNIYDNLTGKFNKNNKYRIRYFRHNGLKNISNLICKIKNEI